MIIIMSTMDHQKKQVHTKRIIKITNSFKLEIFLNIFVTEKKINFIWFLILFYIILLFYHQIKLLLFINKLFYRNKFKYSLFL